MRTAEGEDDGRNDDGFHLVASQNLSMLCPFHKQPATLSTNTASACILPRQQRAACVQAIGGSISREELCPHEQAHLQLLEKSVTEGVVYIHEASSCSL